MSQRKGADTGGTIQCSNVLYIWPPLGIGSPGGIFKKISWSYLVQFHVNLVSSFLCFIVLLGKNSLQFPRILHFGVFHPSVFVLLYKGIPVP